MRRVCLTLLWFSYLSHIRVSFLRVDASVFLHILESVGHVPASTAVVLGDTVHQVLGTQVHEVARFLGQLALQSSGRTERPAGTTGTLSGEAVRGSVFKELYK